MVSTNTKLAEALRLFLQSAYPVCTTIDARGYRWREEFLADARDAAYKALAAHEESLRDNAEQAQEPVLQDIEQYRMQMAAISTAALGYWKEGDSIHPDYDTVALRDVAMLYAKYDELFKIVRAPVEQVSQAKPAPAQAVPAGFVPWHYASLALNYLAGCGEFAPDALKKAHEMLGPQAAPAPESQAVPMILSAGEDTEYSYGYQAGWNACRRAWVKAPAAPAPEAQPAGQDERAAFEEWFSGDEEFDLNPAWGNRTREGKYAFPDVQEAWEAWQARAALAQRQPLTDQDAAEAVFDYYRHFTNQQEAAEAHFDKDLAIFRLAERACAEAWGVKLAGATTGKEPGNGQGL